MPIHRSLVLIDVRPEFHQTTSEHSRVEGVMVVKCGDIRPITQHRPIGAFKCRVSVVVQNSDLVFLHWLPRLDYRQFACRRSTLAFAPRSSAKSKPADGNFSFMALIRPTGSLAVLSSSLKTSKYLSVKSTAVLASRAAPTLLCPGTTTEGFSSLTFLNVSSHFALALLSVSAV